MITVENFDQRLETETTVTETETTVTVTPNDNMNDYHKANLVDSFKHCRSRPKA